MMLQRAIESKFLFMMIEITPVNEGFLRCVLRCWRPPSYTLWAR
jgi:hypothetical protein